MTDALQREIILGLLKIHILHHACAEGIIGHQILVELRGHGHDVSPGTVYPMLHRMEQRGWICKASVTPGARGSRRYEITPVGRDQLAKLRVAVRELYLEIDKPCLNPHVRIPANTPE